MFDFTQVIQNDNEEESDPSTDEYLSEEDDSEGPFRSFLDQVRRTIAFPMDFAASNEAENTDDEDADPSSDVVIADADEVMMLDPDVQLQFSSFMASDDDAEEEFDEMLE